MPEMNEHVDINADRQRAAAEIEFMPTPAVRDALAKLGRTEDIRFSPDNLLAALAGYGRNTCLLLSVKIGRSAGDAQIILDDYYEIHSPSINDPHGFDFLGDNRLLVANRSGTMTIFRLPPPPYRGQAFILEPERSINRTGLFHRLRTPGSVATVERAKNVYDVYACNTFHNRVSSHRIRTGGIDPIPRGRIVASGGLDIPDGVAVSPDKRYLAISNHNFHCVSIFDLNEKQGPDAKIVGTLSGPSYPHGLRFSPDGKSLYAADAGEPVVHRFDAPSGNWAINVLPSKSVSVLPRQVFLAGRHNEQEGGPKGLDFDSSGSIMAITCEEQPLAFFSVEKLFG